MTTARHSGASRRTFVLDAPWMLSNEVQIRPERFGALLYNFSNRRLSLIKTPTLLAVIRALGNEPTARAAMRSAGVAQNEMATYSAALSTLAVSQMICEGKRS